MEKAILQEPDRNMEALKSLAQALQNKYNGNIKIELNVNKKLKTVKTKITEHIE